MELLKKRIMEDGVVKGGNVLKVDSFLNHQIDISLYNEIAKEFYNRYKDCHITKILTIEASGIGLACITAQYFCVPVIFAKKSESLNLDGDIYTSSVYSFTHQKKYTIMVSKKFISREDKILIIDDFLANGKALLGLIDIVNQAESALCGAGIVIEKGFQGGGALIRSMGIRVESLAVIKSMENGSITFA